MACLNLRKKWVQILMFLNLQSTDKSTWRYPCTTVGGYILHLRFSGRRATAVGFHHVAALPLNTHSAMHRLTCMLRPPPAETKSIQYSGTSVCGRSPNTPVPSAGTGLGSSQGWPGSGPKCPASCQSSRPPFNDNRCWYPGTFGCTLTPG